jgi:PAS domain S-box-containing protein
VGEELADRQRRRIARGVGQAGELLDVLRHGILEREPPLVAQLQDGEGGEALGHGSDAKGGVESGGRIGGDVAHAEPLAMGQLAVDHDAESEAGEVIQGHAAGQVALDLGEGRGQRFTPIGPGEPRRGMGLVGPGGGGEDEGGDTAGHAHGQGGFHEGIVEGSDLGVRPRYDSRGVEPREGTMAMDQAAAARVVNEYLDELDRRQKEGPLRLREGFEKSPLGVGVHELDKEMRVVRVNPEELRILGYREDEMVGRVVWEIIVMQDASRRAIEQKLKGERELRPFVRSFKKADGTAIPLLLADRHIRDVRGEIVGLRTAMTEIRPDA